MRVPAAELECAGPGAEAPHRLAPAVAASPRRRTAAASGGRTCSTVTCVSLMGGSLSSSCRRSRLRYMPAVPAGFHTTSRFRGSRDRKRASAGSAGDRRSCSRLLRPVTHATASGAARRRAPRTGTARSPALEIAQDHCWEPTLHLSRCPRIKQAMLPDLFEPRLAHQPVSAAMPGHRPVQVVQRRRLGPAVERDVQYPETEPS